ncbi:hypothetical protein OG730_00885 [Streptomyces sp. NBC_01298]|uniref:hypothetical protein n=1 Tax=Streptomyces sp. NBC_01298 TaxID=2903817 RepID=UPI002E14FC1B|nr:hypothetical protein OG730_00885 [Streptomyces sp. NBC_01298]
MRTRPPRPAAIRPAATCPAATCAELGAPARSGTPITCALLFPGQGEQRPGTLRDLPDHPAVGRTLDELSEALGEDVRGLDTAEALRSNAATQLALFSA